jgi:hypothetical protein
MVIDADQMSRAHTRQQWEIVSPLEDHVICNAKFDATQHQLGNLHNIHNGDEFLSLIKKNTSL